jgi:hypothetical protein
MDVVELKIISVPATVTREDTDLLPSCGIYAHGRFEKVGATVKARDLALSSEKSQAINEENFQDNIRVVVSKALNAPDCVTNRENNLLYSCENHGPWGRAIRRILLRMLLTSMSRMAMRRNEDESTVSACKISSGCL